MMRNVMVRPCLNKEIIKISNLIPGKVLRITHVLDRNLTESRIYPKAEFDRMFRSSEVWIEHTTL